jgi:hypothetical protein
VSVGYKLNRLVNFDRFFLQGGLEFQGFKKIGIGLIAGRFFILNSFGREFQFIRTFTSDIASGLGAILTMFLKGRIYLLGRLNIAFRL